MKRDESKIDNIPRRTEIEVRSVCKGGVSIGGEVLLDGHDSSRRSACNKFELYKNRLQEDNS